MDRADSRGIGPLTASRRTLDRFLSRCGVATREEAARAIGAGRVTVDGAVVRDAGHWIDPSRVEVRFDGTLVEPPSRTIVLVANKPRGVVTTLADPEGRPTVRDALPERFRDDRSLRPIGRLDRASAGLLLWTNDTDLADRLLGPGSGIDKEQDAGNC